MSALKRGTRNVYRHKGRTLLTVVILGLSVGIFVAMAETKAGMDAQIQFLKAEVERLIELRVPGGTGMGSGAEILPAGIPEALKDIPYIAKVEKYLFVREVDNTKRYPVSVRVGVTPGEAPRLNSHGEVGTPKLIAGRSLAPEDAGKKVAVVGKVFAEESPGLAEALRRGKIPSEGVPFGIRFTVDGNRVVEEFRAVGFFESGFVFGDNQVIIPLDTLQGILNKKEAISNMFITVNAAQNVEQVERNLLNAIGDKADILTGMSRSRFAEQIMGEVVSSSQTGVILSGVIAALVILFTMILVTRERTKEIGVLKALGARDWDVAAQFTAEAVALALIGGFGGVLVFSAVGPALASTLLGLERVSVTGLTGMGEQPASDLIGYGLSAGAMAWVLGLSLLLGFMGSIYPVLRAIRMRPMEAIRRV